jgi:hypothetical protein
MDLGLTGQSVVRVIFDYAVTLLTDNDVELRIETGFSIRPSDAAPVEVAAGATASMSSVLILLHHKFTSSTCENSGLLSLEFDNGAVVRVSPDATYEAWTLAGPHGEKIVCLPGVILSEWKSN